MEIVFGISANQETIVELMNFYNTLFPSGQTQPSKADLQTITENEVARAENEQVGIVLAFCSLILLLTEKWSRFEYMHCNVSLTHWCQLT